MTLSACPTPRPQRKMAPTQSKPLAPRQSPIPNRYHHKSVALKSRIAEITTSNAASRERVARNNRTLARAQLERAFLLEQVAKLTSKHETEDSPESPTSKVVTPPQRPRMRGNRGPGKGPNRNRGRPKNAGAPKEGEVGGEPLGKKTKKNKRVESWEAGEEEEVKTRLFNEDTFDEAGTGNVHADIAMTEPMVTTDCV